MSDESPGAVARRLREGNLVEVLLREGPETVLTAGPIGMTRSDMRRRAESVAGGLSRSGIHPGDRVAIYGANSLDWVAAYLGTLRAGAVVVGMNPAYRAAEAAHIVSDSEPAVVIADAERAPIAAGLGARTIALEDLPTGEPPGRPKLGPESPALLLYTSGTTGRPKGALLDHGNLLAQARGAVSAWAWTSRDVLVHALPLFHLHGLGMGLNGTLVSGGSALFVPFSPDTVVDHLASGGGTMFFGVPAMYQRLCEHLEAHPADLHGVRLFVSGSAPLPPALFERCARLLGQPPVERYGITEGGIVVSNTLTNRQPGRVGLPLPGVEVRLGHGDEVLLRGGQIFSGYWRNQAATAESLTTDGFLRTGDVGELGPDGTLAIRGRIKELIISGGFNVYPREVELVLEQHPAVAQVAVVGIESERWGEEVTAFVVTDGPSIEGADLIAFARERLAPYKCPRTVVFADALPRNAMGKVERLRLPALLGLARHGEQLGSSENP